MVDMEAKKMGIFDFLKKKKANEATAATAPQKEEGEPREISAADMEQYYGTPFFYDMPITYHGPGAFDPWRMELSQSNIFVAEDQIAQLNAIVQRAFLCSEAIPLDLSIPEDRINYSMSFIICSPYTKTGKKSKYPFSLVFQTGGKVENITTGRIDYFQDGTVGKAKTTIWKNGLMYSLQYKTVGRSFVLQEVKTNKGQERGALPITIYKAEK